MNHELSFGFLGLSPDFAFSHSVAFKNNYVALKPEPKLNRPKNTL